ncbi:DsbA family oxidoreductase [Photobacterium rosenbergii]|uniref:DsbA family oxidoreductase n=1 Tax=Photobacterium rosenbergii TaxID=294936 RepID=A0ABU3ZJW1_9GAMM|nr:DsbA family oxidoreductase [Photobacterium rosenbergii]MDV5170387.1 DsbA family oxidoreductase [Photobacterium rosenbergii]
MAEKIKLDIVSDVVCPWCLVGYKHLEAAINELGMQDRIDIEWQPFELNPDMPPEGENLREHVARKYGSTPEDSQRARAKIAKLGAEHGFTFNYFDEMKMVNTLDAHVLLEFAKEYGKQTELKMGLFSAFFSKQKDVSDRKVLLDEVATVGLDRQAAQSRLEDMAHRDEIRSVEAEWQQLGVSAVPTVVFNRTSALTGAQEIETYKQVLLELVNEQAT